MSSTKVQTVYVVMGNDYPGGVFSSKELADSFINDKKAECASKYTLTPSARIYWRAYEYILDDTGANNG